MPADGRSTRPIHCKPDRTSQECESLTKKKQKNKNVLFFALQEYFRFIQAITNIYCYRKEEMNEFMAVNHNSIMHRPGFSSFTAVSRVQGMYIKQVLVDFKITMSPSANGRSLENKAVPPPPQPT